MSDHAVAGRAWDDEFGEQPPYRAVLVVDTKEFGSNSDTTQDLLARTVPDVLARAFQRAELVHVWQDALFPHDTGDGVGIGFDSRYLPLVVGRFFDALQDVLAEQNRQLQAHDRRTRLRMRASLHVGPVREQDRGGRLAGVGSTVITAHRLLDSSAVREGLTRSDPEQTFLSVVLSQRVFDDVLATGYASLPTSRVVPVSVHVKELAGTAYVYVPNPSGDLLTHGVAEYQREPETASGTQPRSVSDGVANIMTGVHNGTSIQVGHLGGDMHTGPS